MKREGVSDLLKTLDTRPLTGFYFGTLLSSLLAFLSAHHVANRSWKENSNNFF
jgi:hypothetical protein